MKLPWFLRRRHDGRHAVADTPVVREQGGWRAVTRAVGGWFGRRPGEEQRAVTSVPWNVGPPLYQRAVTPEQALSLVPVFSAVRLLASQIASLPLQSYRKVGDTRVKIPTGSLFSAPAARGTVFDWLHRCVTSLALRGNAYGLVTARDQFGYPTMVEWLHPDHVTVQDTALSGPGSPMMPLWYWLGRPVPAEDLIHIAWFTMPGMVRGLSPIEACAATISTGVSAQVYTSDWFNNGAVPPGKFKNTQKTVSQTESDEIKARLNAAIRSRKPLVYGADWDYEPIAVSANEARFIETMQLNATQIAAIYGIPPEMLGGQAGGSLTYNTVEQNTLNFVKFSLRPWLELLEEVFSALLPRGQYVRFNLDALLRGDLMTRMNAAQVARQIGLNNVDELRALEEYAPLPNGEGKDYTPLVVQVAASRGIDAAEVAHHQPASDQPSTDQPLTGQNGKGPTGTRDSGPFGPTSSSRRPISGAEAATALEARRYDPTDPAYVPDMRGFDPLEPRDPHSGKWIGAGGGSGAAKGLEHVLHDVEALDAPPKNLDDLTRNHDPRADSLWFRTGDNSPDTDSGDPGFVEMNTYMRHGGHDPAMAQRVKDIGSVMRESKLRKPIAVYRGMDTSELGAYGELKGVEFSDKAFVSTTTDRAHAKNFSLTILTIRVPPGVGAVRMADRDRDLQESEILLDRGLRYRIVDEKISRNARGRIASHEVLVEVVA